MQKKKTLPNTVEDCSTQQLEAISKLREKIRDSGYPESSYDDGYLFRFLSSRKFDIEKTLQMWKNFIDWRKNHNIDQVISMEFPEMEEARQHYPHLWFRTDKKGRPIYIERMGKLNLDKILKTVSTETLELYFIRDYERLLQEKLPACSKAYGETVSNTCYIMDMKGATANLMSPKVWELLRLASKIGQEYYPETLGDMIVVNAPMFCYGAWNVIKYLMDEKTRSRIHIFGTNYKKELLKYIDEENLPDFLGGKAKEEEYGGPCLTKEQGPWVKSSTGGHLPEKEIHCPYSNSPIENDIVISKLEPGRNVNDIISPASELEEEENFDDLDIAQELPLRQDVKNLMIRPSTEFNWIPIAQRFG